MFEALGNIFIYCRVYSITLKNFCKFFHESVYTNEFVFNN